MKLKFILSGEFNGFAWLSLFLTTRKIIFCNILGLKRLII